MKRVLIISTLLGLAYLLIEVIFNAVLSFDIRLRGATSLWMFPIGAIMGTILGAMNNIDWIKKHINYFWQCIIGVVLIYAIEYTSGTVLTSIGIVVWRYTDVLNINGQITLFYIPVWFALCPLAFWLEDLIRWWTGADLVEPMALIEYYKLAINPGAKP